MTHYISWVVTAPQHEHFPTRDKFSEIICQHLNLCISVGCGCIVDGNDELCNDESIQNIKRDFGPRWSVVATSLTNNQLKIDAYIEPPVYEHEIYNLRMAIKNNIYRPVNHLDNGVNL